MKFSVVSEMARNANEHEFQTSKMAAGGHFEKKNESLMLIGNDEKCKQKQVIFQGRKNQKIVNFSYFSGF